MKTQSSQAHLLQESFPALDARYRRRRDAGEPLDELVGLAVARPWFAAIEEVLPLEEAAERLLALPGKPGRGFGPLIVALTRELGTAGMLPVVLITEERVTILRVPVE
jgi:hypothetical protein